MGLKKALYAAGRLIWVGLVAVAWVILDQGYTEPWLSFRDIPGGSMGAGVIGVVAALLGHLSISSPLREVEHTKWKKAGRQAGLPQSEPGGNTSGPILTGTVDGRTVTASYDKRKMSSGDEGTRRVTFTRCGVELAGAADEAVVVGRTGEAVDAGVGTIDFNEIAESVSATEGLVAIETEDRVFVGT